MCCVDGEVLYVVARDSGFRPLAGMCCVEKAVRNLCCKSVSVPWRGCVASEAEDENNAVFVFPSPGGDVLRPKHHGLYNLGSCFRPLAGMCCVGIQIGAVGPLQAFPSPGGDVLRRQICTKLSFKKEAFHAFCILL